MYKQRNVIFFTALDMGRRALSACDADNAGVRELQVLVTNLARSGSGNVLSLGANSNGGREDVFSGGTVAQVEASSSAGMYSRM